MSKKTTDQKAKEKPKKKTVTLSASLSQLGQLSELPKGPAEAVLEVVPNPNPDRLTLVRFSCPEFTSLCPVTGQPDFAHFVIDYAPDGAIIESKSLKLYLNSLAMTRFHSAEEICAAIVADLSRVVAHEISLQLDDNVAEGTIDQLPGRCIDTLDPAGSSSYPDPSVLEVMGDQLLSEDLHSHLLRSNCPVTGQPDAGSILIRYRGRPIDAASLLQYLISYRQHNAFHEACVERIFVDLKRQCAPEQLTVYARYNRRGGIDINPFRSDFEASAENLRLKRQ